ncbi:MAG: peptide deformylase [Cereibacter sphaeroides]|uniref:Peptide deformylase n=1 Tax=Cereibacter sphaeroides TaxID=1063 RepID=A0A2W5TQC0_CERSP|nr:MAG: peptide deformylase [Cereibacter sphaeroides]
MAVLPILQWPDTRLSVRCMPVAPGGGARKLAEDMLETMYAAEGRGLAAPQVGITERLFVMDEGWKIGRPSPVILTNPVIAWVSSELATGPEVCLSIPGVTAHVSRSTALRLRWIAVDGTPREELLTGFAAICAQHEMDHLDGIVTLDHLSAAERTRAEAALAA